MLTVMFTPLVLVFGGLDASFFRPIFFGAPSYRSELSPSARPGCARRNVSTKARARSCDTSFKAMLNCARTSQWSSVPNEMSSTLRARSAEGSG